MPAAKADAAATIMGRRDVIICPTSARLCHGPHMTGCSSAAADAGQQHGAVGLDVNEFHGVHIGKGEQKCPDRRTSWRDFEMPDGEAPKAEEADGGGPRHHKH